jgi:hypothetical protein
MVTVDDGQLPHAPLSLSFTTRPVDLDELHVAPVRYEVRAHFIQDLLHVVGGELELLGD